MERQRRRGAKPVVGAFLVPLGDRFAASFLINHFHLFGLRQVYLYMKGREFTDVGFRTPLLYKLARHPTMLRLLIAFWVTPEMSVGHALFAVGTTAYILIALQLEKHDLVSHYGATYREYQHRVPKIPPLPGRK